MKQGDRLQIVYKDSKGEITKRIIRIAFTPDAKPFIDAIDVMKRQYRRFTISNMQDVKQLALQGKKLRIFKRRLKRYEDALINHKQQVEKNRLKRLVELGA